MLKNKTLTYISLFSCAGVGCFGFKKAGFECIATNELIERRLNVQKFNNKCKYESGYICDDITTDETKEKMQDIAEKLFILLHGYSYFCDSIEGEIFQDNALKLSSYAYLLKEYIIGVKEKYTEILDILDVAN